MASGKLTEPHTGGRLNPEIETAAPGIADLREQLFRQGYDLHTPGDVSLVARLIQKRYGGEILEARAFTPKLDPYRPSRPQKFKKAFGESKITDAKGNPVVLYHGSESKFQKFRSKGSGIWFARKADDATPGSGAEKGVLKASYLKVEKPYRLTAAELKEFQASTNP